MQQLERLNEVFQHLELLVPSLVRNQLAVQRGEEPSAKFRTLMSYVRLNKKVWNDASY